MEKVYFVPDNASCPSNSTMFQGFEWYIPSDHQHWARLAEGIPSLATLGVTSIWIPPAAKAASPRSNGYDIYDLYDLGEFQQKGARHTKWGTKEELALLVKTANNHGIGILFDAVLNHKTGADCTETAVAVKVDPEDRLKVISKPQKIDAWTKFNFPGRGAMYSPLKWSKEHFTGVDHNQRSKVERGIWRFQSKKWACDVDEELGNYDFLMCSNVDHNHPDVRRDLFHWVEWLGSQFQLGGLRLDAIKHYSASFQRDLIKCIDEKVGRGWLVVGEYWRADAKVLSGYIEYMNNRLSLFDIPLVQSFSRISRRIEPDFRKIFNGTLAIIKPANAVTFVVNHDTQTGQTLETPIEPFFIPIAYAIILLRANFGLPCVFWADIYGTLAPPYPRLPPHGGLIVPRLMLARRLWAYGTEVAYFSDSSTCIGFTRFGHPSQSGGAGLAVIMNTAWRFDAKRMCVGRRHAGERWTEVLEQVSGEVVIDESGYGTFLAGPRGVAVWVNKEAEGRKLVDLFVLYFHVSDHKNYRVVEEAADDLHKLPTSFPPWLRSALQSRKDNPAREPSAKPK